MVRAAPGDGACSAWSGLVRARVGRRCVLRTGHVHAACAPHMHGIKHMHGIQRYCPHRAGAAQSGICMVHAHAWHMQVLLKAGHAAFHHALTVHGSWANRSAAPRRALVINLFAHGACMCYAYACARYMHMHMHDPPPRRAADLAHSTASCAHQARARTWRVR